MKTKILTLVATMLLIGVCAFAQSNGTLRGDVNEDGLVDVADIATIIDIMARGEVTLSHYFYLGTTKPTAENYKILSGAETSFTSIDDAVGTSVSISAGEILYMLCPIKWMYGRTVSLENETGEIVNFSESIDSLTIPGYAVYSTQVLTDRKNVVLKADNGQNDEGETSVTGIATNITKNSATITAYANGILDNLATDIRVGIIYTSNGTPSRSNGTIVDVNNNAIASDGSYSINLTGLTPETTYSYRSFVYQSGIWFYGDIRNFTTAGSGEAFTTGAVSSVTCFSAKVAASVNIDSSSPYTTMTYGICYGTSIDPTMDNQHTVATNRDSSTGEFTTILRGLYGGTTYYFRPYAVIDGVTKYGQSSQFKTLDDNVVETIEVNIEAGTATAHLMLGGGDYSNIQLGFCYSKSENPIYTKGSVTTDEVNDEHLFTVFLPPLYGYKYYRSFVLIDGTPHYGNIINTSSISIQEGEAVDLGLSVKWAPMNVGAAQPSDSGLYFAWGETEAKTKYDWSTYKYCEGTSNSITKYCTNSAYGTVDGKTSLELADDAANANWGGNWRMPTENELNELKNYCTWVKATVNDVAGYYVTGKNGNRIFISNGSYWSNTMLDGLNSGASSLAVSYNIVTYNQIYLYYPSRSADVSVRPVTDY